MREDLPRPPSPPTSSCSPPDRGLAGYWRTPALLRSEEGRAAAAVPAEERVVGLLHLGHPRQERPVPERPRIEDTVVFLD